MNQIGVIGFVSPWIADWLTPVWILCLGVLAGVLLCAAVWCITAALSMIPPIGSLAEKKAGRTYAAGVLFVIFGFLAIRWFIAPNFAAWRAEGTNVAIGNLLTAIIVLIPISLGLAMACVHLVSRRMVSETWLAIREGVLWPLFIIGIVLSIFGLIGGFVSHQPLEILRSLKQLASTGSVVEQFEIEPAPRSEEFDEFSKPPQTTIPVQIDRDQLHYLQFLSDQRLEVETFSELQDVSSSLNRTVLDVAPNESVAWLASSSAFPEKQITELFVRNFGRETANLQLTIATRPVHPQVAVVPIAAIGVLTVFLLYLLQRAAMPRVSAIALATFKSEVAQPLFAILLGVGCVAIIVFIWIPYFTLGDDIKMLKDTSLVWIMLTGIFQAVWAASTSVSEEIEGRTALTVLSKPLGRRSFVIGKFLGIAWTVALLFIVMGFVLLVVVSYKPIYDARESGGTDVTWQLCHFEVVRTVPGLVLALMETVVLAALSVAISTRLPLLVNLVICFAIYALGHLTPLIVQTSDERFEIVRFFGRFIATVFPNLDHFNIQAAVATGTAIPLEYLGWSLVYCLVYTLIAMFLALVMFEDRDLA